MNKDHESLSLGLADLVENAKFMESLITLCPDGVIGVDRNGVVNLFNQTAERLMGLDASQVLGNMHIQEIYGSPLVARQIKRQIYSPELGGPNRVEGLEVDIRHREGHFVPIRLSAVIIHEHGQEVGSIGFFHDLTHQRTLENELRRLSVTDSLTGLANRRHFHCMLTEEVGRCERYSRPLCLICFDLDNFKPFNDNFGHQEGDGILRLAGDCARACLRNQDTAFRVGGDEFMLLLVETTLSDAIVAGQRFRDTFNRSWPKTASRPGKSLKPVSLSMGVAQFVPGERAEGLIMRADLAMYEAKRGGGDRLAVASERISHSRSNQTNTADNVIIMHGARRA